MSKPLLETSYRRTWIAEAICLLVAMLATTWFFWTTPMDVNVASQFYDANDAHSQWPMESLWLWQCFYRGAPWITALTGAAGLGLIIASLVRREKRLWRAYGVFIILSVLLGPGLLINAVFKDNWQRPRPRNIEQFGGTQPYVPPLEIGPEGKSFPCGHCSVGFVTVVFYFLLRRRHRLLSILALLATFALGFLMGYGRMVAGAHYLSDVLWACFITVGAVMFAYYGIVRIPQREEQPERFAKVSSETPRRLSKRTRWTLAITGLSLLLLVPVVFFIPFEQRFSAAIAVGSIGGQPTEIVLEVTDGDFALSLINEGELIHYEERFKGFGIPGSRVAMRNVANTPGSLYHMRWHPKGLPTEIEGGITATVNINHLKSIRLLVPRGTVSIESTLPAALYPEIIVDSPSLRLGKDVPVDKVQSSHSRK
ncbi:MAG: phosphatase PAP2 family protein [Verrucomicrobiota bacterium]|nr:phosphatase PAP2 family protein [Verrucomicrobiota bacterium]